MTALYTDGTITLVNGSPIITGIDTAWKVSNIVGGTVFAEIDGGSPLPILPNDSDAANLHPITDTQMTAAIKWTGPSGTYKYAIVRETSYNRQQAVNAEKLGDLLAQLDAPLLAALSSVEGLQDHLILLTGPSTLSLIPRNSLLEGVKRDETVNTLAGLATYSGEIKGFAVLVANAGGGRAAIYVKRSNADGDWSEPVYITGAEGDTGNPGPYTTIQIGDITTLNPGQDATITQTQVSPGVVRWDFGIPKGLDGEGTGDVVGPAAAVANRVAVFADTTGKVLKDGGFILGNAASRNVGTAAGTVAAGDDPRFASGGNSQNEAIIALALADLQGKALGMKGGVADAFEDETGVDIAVSIRFADAIASGLVNTAANINDNNPATSASWVGSDITSANPSARKLAQLDLGSVKTITKIEAVGHYSSVGANNGGGLYYSVDGANWTQLGANIALNTASTTFTSTGTVSARYVALILMAANFSSATVYLGDLNAYGYEAGAGSSNAVYDAVNDWYLPASDPPVDQTATHTGATQNGNTVSASSQYDANYPPWKAFNKSLPGANVSSNSWATPSGVSSGWLQYQFASAKTIKSYSITSINTAARAPSAWTLLGSNTGAFNGEQVVLDTRSSQNNWAANGEKRRFSVAAPGSYIYYRLNITGTNGEALLHFDEVTLDTVSDPQNMELLSRPFPLVTSPAAGRVTVQTVEFDAGVPNVDFAVDLSRDGGTTFKTANLTAISNLAMGNIKMYEDASLSFASLPAGSSLKWRFRTLTNKNIGLSGIVAHGGN